MKKGLGRNFESLIPTNLIDETFDPTAKQDGKMSLLQDIRLTNITPDPEQPRRFFDEAALGELAESVRLHGVVQPIVVTQRDGAYVIVAGERRWRAAKLAGLETIPAIVRSMSDQHRLEVSLIENLQRRDLNPIETATAYLKLREQFNLTLEEIGQRVGGKSISSVSNTLRLLKLPKLVQEAIFAGTMTEGQARSLIGLPDEIAEFLCKKAVTEDWSSRRIEQWVTLWREDQKNPEKKDEAPREKPHLETIQHLSSRLNTSVDIRTNSRGAGKIVISFKDHDEFERVSKLLG